MKRSILILFILCLIPGHISGQEQKDSDKWLSIEKWRGTFNRVYEIKGEKKLQYWTEKFTYRETTSGAVVLYDKYQDSPGSVMWSGLTSGTTTIVSEHTWDIAGSVYSVKGSGSGSFNLSMEDAPETGLYIDLESGTYSFGAGGSPEKGLELKGEFSDKDIIAQIENPVVRDLFLAMIEGMEKNPGSISGGLVMMDVSQQQTNDFIRNFSSGNNEDNLGEKLPDNPGTLSGSTSYQSGVISSQFSWSLTPGGDSPPEYFLTLNNKQEFKQHFIPEKGAVLFLKVYSKDKDALPVNIRFRMAEVSKEPGVCLNSGDNNDQSDDMRFRETSGGAQMQQTGARGLMTINETTEAELELEILDYGAYGTIIAEIEFDAVWIPIKNDLDQNTELLIPWDQNYNRIADAWEKSVGILGKNYDSLDDYEDKPKLDGAIGDGLTLYEEYRGVIANGNHQRLNPKVKELIVENRIGQKIKGGLDLFEKASGIKVIELDAAELPPTRQVNLNSDYGKSIDQYGIIIEQQRGGTSDNTGAECRPTSLHRKTPKLCEKIVVFSNLLDVTFSSLPENEQNLTSEVEFNSNWQIKISQSVAHEMGHAVGAQHHTLRSEGVTDSLRYSIANEHSFERAFDENGNPLTSYPVTINPPSGFEHGLASGDVNCIMCYTDFYFWVKRMEQLPGESQPRVVFRRYSPPPVPQSFCTSGAATGVNREKNGFGDADEGLGNCLGQMRVIDIER